MLQVRDWSETFENAKTRKLVRLGWFLCPSGSDSNGYVELMSHGEDGIKAFGVFMAICQWSATRRPSARGLLCRTDGTALSEKQMATHLRMDVRHLSAAIKLLTSKEIGWIIDDEDGSSATDPPPICHKEKEKEKEKENSLYDSDESNGAPKKRNSYSPQFEMFWKAFPKLRRTAKGRAWNAWKVALGRVDDADAPAYLVKRAIDYASSPRGQSEFAQMPSTWLTGRCWEDTEESWMVGKGGMPKQSRLPTPEEDAAWNPNDPD